MVLTRPLLTGICVLLLAGAEARRLSAAAAAPAPTAPTTADDLTDDELTTVVELADRFNMTIDDVLASLPSNADGTIPDGLKAQGFWDAVWDFGSAVWNGVQCVGTLGLSVSLAVGLFLLLCLVAL